MKIDFTGRRCVVAAGSRGIGRAIALGFAAAGGHVSVCARGADGVERIRAELAAHGNTVHAAVCDLADAAAIPAYIDAAAAALGGIDVLVNNGSGFGMTADEASWAAELSVDIMAVVRACKAAQPHLERSPAPAILNISSINALKPGVRTPAYGAAKAAMNHYTTTLAAGLAPHKIRVNAICPGSIEFPGGTWEKRKESEPELYANTLKKILFGRYGKPEEIANVALFLSSPLAGWVTGQIIAVDGGQVLSG